MTQKPMSVARREFMDEVVKLVNESGLPLFVVEPILKELHGAVQMEAENQFQREKAAYEEALKQEAIKEAVDAKTEAVPV